MKKIFIILIFLLINSCEKKIQLDEFPHLDFVNDSSLVGQRKHFNGISLSLPTRMEKIENDKFSIIKNQLEKIKNSYFITNVLAVYQNADSMVLIISQINHDSPIYNELDKEFEEGLAINLGADYINKGQFSIGGLKIIQFIVSNEEITNYKLYINVKGTPCYQIDYLINTKYFNIFRGRKEMSISTIKIKEG